MFESMVTRGFAAAWGDRPAPLPGEPGWAEHQAYLAYESQQIAFWNSYGADHAPPEDVLPNLNGARTDVGLLGEVGRQARRENAAAGAKLRAVADYALRKIANPTTISATGSSPAAREAEEYLRRSVEAEIACELKLPPAVASSLLHLALTLARRLPRTFAALEAGELTKAAAEVIADESADLNDAACSKLEDEVLPDAGQRSYRSLRTKVRRVVARLDADAVRTRAERAREDRTLYVKDEPDGMATLCLYVPAPVARAIYDAINDQVLTAQATLKTDAAAAPLVIAARDDRRVGAQRADTVVDVLGAALGIDPWTPPVPVTSFLTAEQITALNKGRTTYRPSPAMTTAVRNRDKHCRFPGCRRPARQSDLDHTIPFGKINGKLLGPGTVYDNLGALCRFHHQIKQLPGWAVEQDTRGRFTWTTPTGIRFITHPPPDDSDRDGDGDEPPDFARVNDDVPPF